MCFIAVSFLYILTIFILNLSFLFNQRFCDHTIRVYSFYLKFQSKLWTLFFVGWFLLSWQKIFYSKWFRYRVFRQKKGNADRLFIEKFLFSNGIIIIHDFCKLFYEYFSLLISMHTIFAWHLLLPLRLHLQHYFRC